VEICALCFFIFRGREVEYKDTQKTDTYIGDTVSLLRGTFGLNGRITQSEDDRSLVVGRHRLQKLLGESPTHCSCTNGSGRFHFLTHLLQATYVLKFLRVKLLLVSDASTLTILQSQNVKAHSLRVPCSVNFRLQ